MLAVILYWFYKELISIACFFFVAAGLWHAIWAKWSWSKEGAVSINYFISELVKYSYCTREIWKRSRAKVVSFFNLINICTKGYWLVDIRILLSCWYYTILQICWYLQVCIWSCFWAFSPEGICWSFWEMATSPCLPSALPNVSDIDVWYRICNDNLTYPNAFWWSSLFLYCFYMLHVTLFQWHYWRC